jgi:nucleoside-diphosphate-sugar epimerase
MRALITGVEGFLGRHFAAELERRSWEVEGCDITDALPLDCRSFFADIFGPPVGHYNLVVHCAAVVGGRAKIEGSPLETAVNLELDAAMFRWAARSRPGRVLYISSSAAYPVTYQGTGPLSAPLPLVENYQVPGALIGVGLPDAVYGWSKVIGEVLAGELRKSGVPVTVVRPFSGYGTDQSPDYPFRAFIDRALRREDPFRLWCGDCVRDFIHVDDVVAGALAFAEAGIDGPVNLCTGVPTSFTELARMVCEAAGYLPEIVPDPAAPAGVAYRVGDPTAMHALYVPKVDLSTGIRRALDGVL